MAQGVAAKPERIEFAVAAGRGRQVPEHALWRVPCSTASGDCALYVKSCSAASLLTELFCSVVGREMGVPIPKPYLVMVDAGQIGDGLPAEQAFMFGFQDEAHPSLAMIATNRGRVVELIRRWSKAPGAAAFDSLIAVQNRTERAWLYGAAEHALWLIDHEGALANPVDAVTGNQMIESLLEGRSEIEVQRLLRDTEAAVARCDSNSVNALTAEPAVAVVDQATPTSHALITFIARRLGVMPQILRQQIKPKQNRLDLREHASETGSRAQAPL